MKNWTAQPRSGDRKTDSGPGGYGGRLRARQRPASHQAGSLSVIASLSPEHVTKDDIIEFMLDGTPVSDKRPPYLERFIHGAVYEARPEVRAVVHSHAEDTLPFSISKTTPLCCVAHVASDMGTKVPVRTSPTVRRRHQPAGDQHGAGPRHGAETG